MKKIITLLAIAFCLNTNAQYTKLLDFAGIANGNQPHGSLMQATDGMLYGMTSNGGTSTNCSTYGCGVLFQYNPTTNTYTKKLDFAGATNGNNTDGSLMQASDGMLYGMTQLGGANSLGTLFQYNPATSTYTKKLDFAGTTNGNQPNGDLMQAIDGTLYGMTFGGGVNNMGVLFQYNPTTNTYTKKLDFAGVTNGQYPRGSLIQTSDSMLYGMTSKGGVNNMGVLFQYNPTTNTYTKKLDFAGTTNGSTPDGSLMLATDGMLYGMTSEGGANNMGILFQYNPTTNTCTKKLDFAGAVNGSTPYGSLIQASDGMLYGMTFGGGANNMGVLFQYNPTNSAYTKKLDFADTTNGKYPDGALIQASDGMLYGMTFFGGANNMGVLFKYNIGITGIEQFASSNGQTISLYPNPTSDRFFIETNTTDKLNVDVYDINGRHVFSASVSDKENINVSSLNNGAYTLTIKTADRVINKKLIILR